MTLESLKAKLLSDPETKKYYEELKMQFNIAKEIIKLRTKFGLTQRQLAEKTGIKQPQIARIEAGKQVVKLETLERIAESLGYSVEVRLVPKERDMTADEFEEEYHRTITRVENEEYEKSKSDRQGIQDWDGGEERYRAYQREFWIEEIGDEEVVTNDDENCWVEYLPPTD